MSTVVNVLQVYSRSLAHARSLAGELGADATDAPSALLTTADYYMVAVSDDVIATVLDATPTTAGVWFHTCGSCPMSVFSGKRERYGVIYPLMSITGNDDFDELPLFIEACNDDVAKSITGLVTAMSRESVINIHHHYSDSEERRRLHLAAVMTCNFTNHIWALAHDLLPDYQGFDIMMPMLWSMYSRLGSGINPRDSQTGPAARGDVATMERHMAMLDGTTRDVYALLSRSIGEMYHTGVNDSKLSRIKGIAFDVDGVLSPSTITMSATGEPMRGVNIKDGYAIQLAVKLGLEIAIITGANVDAVRVRYEGLGVKSVFLGAGEKLPVLTRWAADCGLSLSEVAMVGDDIPDVPAMRAAGLAVAPVDAAGEVRAVATMIAPVRGGHGVARYLIERVLKARGLWLDDTHAFGW